jgi:hypothetical protein
LKGELFIYSFLLAHPEAFDRLEKRAGPRAFDAEAQFACQNTVIACTYGLFCGLRTREVWKTFMLSAERAVCMQQVARQLAYFKRHERKCGFVRKKPPPVTSLGAVI